MKVGYVGADSCACVVSLSCFSEQLYCEVSHGQILLHVDGHLRESHELNLWFKVTGQRQRFQHFQRELQLDSV